MRKIFLLLFVLVSGILNAEEPYRVLILGDLHHDGPAYHAPGTPPRNYVQMWNTKTPLLLQDAATHLDRTFPFVIQIGDITTGDADSMEHQEQMLRDAFAGTKKFFPDHKLLVIKGNHDVRLALKKGRKNSNEPAANALLPLVAKEAGLPELKKGTWAMMQQNDLYIFVDGFDESFDTVKFTEEQLKAHPDARYIFFVTHLPVFPVSLTKPWWLLPNYEKIAELLAGRNAIILAGHTHRVSLVTYDFPGKGKVTQLISTSVALSWNKTRPFKPAIKDYSTYVAIMKKQKKSCPFEKFFPAENYKAYQIYPGACTGFTILEITDKSVTANIYVGPKSKPHPIVLLEKNEAVSK